MELPGWLAGLLPQPSLLKPPIRLLTLILTPLRLQPVSRPPWPCQSLPHLSFSPPGPLSTGLSPGLGS